MIIIIQVKISKDIQQYKSKIFWGFSPRQVISIVIAIVIGLLINFGGKFLPQDLRGFLTMAISVPFLLVGWIKVQGLPFEKYAAIFFRNNFVNRKRVFMNENLYHYIHEANKKKKSKGKYSKRVE